MQRTDPEWRMRGRCLSVDPETFFPEPQQNQTADAALALCSGCAVQASCLAWALDAGDRNGVWGGTTPRERQAMLVAWRNETVPAALIPA
ncbi:MAG: WhiB family transcriptional regulator [Stackebrandtia sp.]